MEDAPGFQFPAHHPGQRAYRSLADIPDAEAGGVQLVPCAHGGDEGDPGPLGFLGQKQLGTHRVDGVHNVVVFGHLDLIPGLRSIKQAQSFHLALRIDVLDTAGHHLCLFLAQSAVESRQLTVAVAQSYFVRVYEGDAPHPGSGQGLGHIGAYAAHAKEQNGGLFQFLLGFLPQQKHLAGKGKIGHNKSPPGYFSFYDTPFSGEKARFQTAEKRISLEGAFALPFIDLQKPPTCAAVFALLKGQVCAEGVHVAPCKTRKSGFCHFFERLAYWAGSHSLARRRKVW